MANMDMLTRLRLEGLERTDRRSRIGHRKRGESQSGVGGCHARCHVKIQAVAFYLKITFGLILRVIPSMAATMKVVTCIAPVNIAVIKYWGKRDETLILPLNDSISTTLSMQEMHAKTTIMASPEFEEDKIWLNGKEESMENPRLVKCLAEMRKRAAGNQSGDGSIPASWHVHVCSENNFPTAAGLASSAAGYACLVFTLAKLYGVSEDISEIARQGSGSACRSVMGGFVRWHRGTVPDGSDSTATQIATASHWPDLRILVLVVNDKQKKTSSTTGMQRSVATSDLLKYRIQNIVPERVAAMEKAIKDKNFPEFAEITMKDSNQFHAVALDTFPPAIYMNDTSHTIAHLVHRYNEAKGETRVAYSYDAGPNACLYMLEYEVPTMLALIDHIFPSTSQEGNYVQGNTQKKAVLSEELLKKINIEPQTPGELKYLISTNVGEGPSEIKNDNEHLLNCKGEPKANQA